MKKGYSENCLDLQTYWDPTQKKCVPCDMSFIKPGLEFSPNCGYTDDGGRRESHTRSCVDGSYNDGHYRSCQPCSSCPEGRRASQQCNRTTDTLCWPKGLSDGRLCVQRVQRVQKRELWRVRLNDPTSGVGRNKRSPGSLFINSSNTLPAGEDLLLGPHRALWMASVFLLACVVAGAVYYLVYRRKRCSLTGQQVQSAPLRVVLDDLDVLEELIILLDPEGSGVKCTRHLASHCSFPATWVNYAYSLRDSRSPLKTLLEGVSTRHPDWTVGDLSRLLGEIGRADAVVVLTKLKPPGAAV